MLKMKEVSAISSLIYNLRVGNSMLTMAGHCNVMLPISSSISVGVIKFSTVTCANNFWKCTHLVVHLERHHYQEGSKWTVQA